MEPIILEKLKRMEYFDFKRLVDSLLVKNRETEWIEFKENFHSKEEIGERISALSNSAYLCNMPYGYIVFGINNDTMKVVGTTFHATRKKVGNEELESWLSTRLNPRIDFEIDVISPLCLRKAAADVHAEDIPSPERVQQ